MGMSTHAQPVRTCCEKCEGRGWDATTRAECDWCEGAGYRQVYYLGDVLAEYLAGARTIPELIRLMRDYARLAESLEIDHWRSRRPLYAESHSMQVMTLRTCAAALARLLLPDPDPPPPIGVVARVRRWWSGWNGRRAA